MLPYRLSRLPGTWSTFQLRVDELLDTVWDVDVLLSEIDRMVALIEPVVSSTPNPESQSELAQVRGFVQERPLVFTNGVEPWTDVLLPFCWDTGCGPN